MSKPNDDALDLTDPGAPGHDQLGTDPGGSPQQRRRRAPHDDFVRAREGTRPLAPGPDGLVSVMAASALDSGGRAPSRFGPGNRVRGYVPFSVPQPPQTPV
jgi:hypothetical protein